MASFGHLYSAYFKATDIPEGVGSTFTITAVKPERVGRDDDKDKLVVYVKEDERGLVLNATRYKSLVDLFGSDDVDTWVGGKIRCVRVRQSFGGKQVAGFDITAA